MRIMMTFEKVLSEFSDYLKQDTDVEVITTSHGYSVIRWSNREQNWADFEHCSSPEKLFTELSKQYSSFRFIQITEWKRVLTHEEEGIINKEIEELKKRCS